MRDAVEMIVKQLVADADAVEVREIEHEGRATIFEVRVAEGDMGTVIGRQGRTVKALRSLLQAAGFKGNHRYVLDLVE